MAPEKYLIRIVRPVFQATYLEAEGRDEKEAANRALAMAGDVPEDRWVWPFNPEDYSYDLHSVRLSQTEDGYPFSLLDFPKYCPLSNDEHPMLGFTATQPWMDWQQPFVLGALFSRWIDLLQEDKADYYDEGINWLEEILNVWKGPDPKVVPLKDPAQRQFEIDMAEAGLKMAKILKETE
jgi:hypothetical protein